MMSKTESDFIPADVHFDLQANGVVCAESPSNIALVKYWGKRGEQMPENPSISYTLQTCKTKTELAFSPKKNKNAQIQVFLGGESQPNFVPKIEKFLKRITPYCPWVEAFDFVVKTHNTFPHSSGIASSASGMSALAKCLIQIEQKLNLSLEIPSEKVSFLARLGSGSACRSVYPGLVLWGKSEFYPKSSDLYATPLAENEIHPIFRTFKDCILLIHEGQKSVSSTLGHNLMNAHPYRETRFSQAEKNIGQLKNILQSGDISEFGALVEHEAMSLHALMMMSSPAYILMQPQTIACIQKIWQYRKETGENLYFTLDAGANVHLLYPEKEAASIETFIGKELLPYTAQGKAIFDSLVF